MSRLGILTAAALFVGCGTLPAVAATIELQVMQGDVFLNNGKGLTAVSGIIAVSQGDQLVLRENAAAVLTYSDQQCFVRLAPASVTRIAEVAPCEGGSFAVVSKTAIIEPTNGVYQVLPPPPAGIAPILAGGGFAAAAAASFVYVTVTDEEPREMSHN